MDPPANKNLRSSGIPRLSKLPVLRNTVKVPPPQETIKIALKSRVLPRKPAENATNLSTPVETNSGTDESMQQPAARSQLVETSVTSNLDDVHSGPPVKPGMSLRRPRPSLMDRTVETLSQIPPSPSPRRRISSLFPPESPVTSSSRSTSSLSRTRPSTSHGQRQPLPSGFSTSRPPSPTKRQLEPTTGNRVSQVTPGKRVASSDVPESPTPSEVTSSRSQPPMPGTGASIWHNDKSVVDRPTMRFGRGSQTLAARPSKQRPSVQGAFTKPLPKLRDKPGGKPSVVTGTRASVLLADSPDSGRAGSSMSKMSSQTSSKPAEPKHKLSKAPASSITLRETIAKAKAARHKTDQPQSIDTALAARVTDESDEIEVLRSDKGLLLKRVSSARTDGRLNISSMGLKKMPIEVLNMYNADLLDPSDGAWYESVDLVRLVAADNDFEQLGEDIFPDTKVDAESAMEDDFQGILFAGLDTIDLHGNQLRQLPLGLRRLEHLITLNLSKNKLGNESLNVITQIRSLRQLRLADNALDGMLTPQLSNLKKLEILDVSNNAITTLSPNSDEISELRVLNVAGNRLLSLPFELLVALPLIEIHAARNRLGGALFPACVPGMPNLKTLDVAKNGLSSIVESGTIELPSLQSLDVTENRLIHLPEMLGWTELLTLTTAGNRLTSLPESIISLNKLKSVNISRNNIKTLDERLGLIDTLAVLEISNNPLRERRLLTMDTDTLKRELRSRLLPEETAESVDGDIMGCQDLGSVTDKDTAFPHVWHIKPGGVVDRSSANLEAIEPPDLESFLREDEVKTLVLHHNLFTQIPQAIEVVGHSLRTLDLSGNKLAGSSCYILTDLLLSNLRSLDLSNNAISSLSPLVDRLSAPQLSEIKLSRNHLTSLPMLRKSFPALASVFASQNSISELWYEPVKGLRLLDVSGNAIVHLDPRLGLLGAEGLRTLVLRANKFRVPRREVIEKGTEAVLAWLKDRISEEEMQGLG